MFTELTGYVLRTSIYRLPGHAHPAQEFPPFSTPQACNRRKKKASQDIAFNVISTLPYFSFLPGAPQLLLSGRPRPSVRYVPQTEVRSPDRVTYTCHCQPVGLLTPLLTDPLASLQAPALTALPISSLHPHLLLNPPHSHCHTPQELTGDPQARLKSTPS